MEQNLVSDKMVSIEGTLLMLDDRIPHVAVPVEAVRDGEVVDTVLSDEDGEYQFIDLKPGQYQVRCQVLGGYVYYGEGRRTVVDEPKAAFLQVGNAITLDNVNFRFAPFKKGTWRYYTVAEGLANMRINAICQDAEGVLWFGTEGGVSRYDGKTFINFTTEDGLASNRVCAIHRDPDGVMWFGADGGVSRYDGKAFVNLTTEDGLVDNRVYAIHSDLDGVLWFGTAGGVSRYDGKTFTNLTTADGLADDIVQTIHRDSQGMMWFGTGHRSGLWWSGGRGVSRYDGKAFVNFTTKDGLLDDRITAIQSDSDGVVWFGTWSGVSRYDGKEFVNFTTKDGLLDSQVIAIQSNSNGVVWFGATYAVSRYDGKVFVNFTETDGLPDSTVTAIHCDPDGLMWFGTDFGGVSRYDEQTFVTLTAADGLPQNYAQAVHCAPDGVMWMGTRGGLSRYDARGMGDFPHFRTFTTSDGLADNAVSAIHSQGHGTLWVGTGKFPGWGGGGVSRYDGKRFTTFTAEDGLVGNGIGAIHCGSDRMLWIGTHNNGLSRYDGKTFVNFSTEDGLAGNKVSAIHRDPDGVMWFGTRGGVSRYDRKVFVTFTTEDGLTHNDVWAIDGAPGGAVWFGTVGGVSRYDGKEFVNFTQKDGLAGSWVTAIRRTTDGVVWFGTQGGGVSGYDGVAWTSLDKRDGLAHNRIFSIDSDSSGALWFGTYDGVTHYRRCSTPPLAHIVSITTDQTYSDLSIIPPFVAGTRVTVEYNSIDLKTLPEKRQYRVAIVEGVADSGSLQKDADNWLPPTRSTTFDYTFDKPGAYTIAVQAIDRDLNYSEPAILELNIQPDPVLVSMQAELNHLRREAGAKYHFESIIGRSPGIRQVRALMERAIDSGLTVLITGETGTGKELVAKAIHYNSPRKNSPLLDRNCGAVPKDLLASDLFGHRRGAFTGAQEDKMGLFETASGGTVLLDEITEMPQDAQAYLLRVLQERKVQRLGEHTSRDIDVRIIAMTNRDLTNEVAADRFREDLFHRLNQFPIHVPPLRERLEDIPVLAEHFLHEYSEEQKKELDGFAPDVFDALKSYAWSGNVRELQNAVRRAAALAEEGKQIQTYHFLADITQGGSLIKEVLSEQVGYKESVDRFRRRLIEEALRESGGIRNEAARRLGMDPSNLRHLIKNLGIKV